MAEMNKMAESQQITVDERGNWQYPSLAAEGYVEVELPSLPGSPNPTERLHARGFGSHVAGKIESSIRGNPYLKSGPQQNPAQVLAHYLGVAKGSKLVGPDAISQMERLAKEFAVQKGEARNTYYKTMVRPFLNGLKPTKRR